jgi:allantoicase
MSELAITAPPGPEPEDIAAHLIDLADPRFGSAVTFATDDFFAPKDRLIDPAPPVFYPDRYDDNGKWMDGWESRRKRVPSHDWCVVRLGAPGRVRAFDIDTSFFTGNYPPQASIQGWDGREEPDEATQWHELVAKSDLGPDTHHLFNIDDNRIWRWLRLNIYPDGGIARLRVFGEIARDWTRIGADETVDLAAALNGGVACAWSDAHFGRPANILTPWPAINMGDGWETARRRGPGNDWCVIRLGQPGTIERAEIATTFYKGNYPERACLRAALLDHEPDTETFGQISSGWPELLPAQPLGADCEHVFTDELIPNGPVSHIRLDIFPDGGISRMRLFGRKAP